MSSNDHWNEYFNQIRLKYQHGTEYTPRTDLENLLNKIKPNEDILIIHESKTTGETLDRPDFKITINNLIIGYIETKPINTNLEAIMDGTSGRDSDQFNNYLNLTDNLIYTNYSEFILIKNKDVGNANKIVLFESDKLTDRSFTIDEIDDNVNIHFESFFLTEPEIIQDFEQLSKKLADRAKLLKEIISLNIDNRQEIYYDRLFGEGGLSDTLRDILIGDLSPDEFIDAYIQTVVYGLLISKFNSVDKRITINNALQNIPEYMGLINEFMHTLDIRHLPSNLNWLLEQIMNILNLTNYSILEKTTFTTNNNLGYYEDPFIFFYETFLKNYDPRLRRTKGIYYTPLPIVWSIIKGIDILLSKHFALSGLENNEVKLLDFATGTGKFLMEAYKLVLSKMGENLHQKIIKEHLLVNFVGFEYLISPYAISHLKLSMLLKEYNYDLNPDERIQVYLTDTLDNSTHSSRLFQKISLENEEATNIKLTKSILVVLGNPPYNDRSRNNKPWIMDLIKLYRKNVPPRDWRNINDDYIKFIRYAHWKIERNGEGIIGIITNNMFLGGASHYEMRRSVIDSFNYIYIINLHGATRRGEKDQNVFDIRQGVCIIFLIKTQLQENRGIYYYSTSENEIKSREDKYKFLLGLSKAENLFDKIEWVEVHPEAPDYWLQPRDPLNYEEYDNGWALSEKRQHKSEERFIFDLAISGLKTDNDPVTIHLKKENLKKTISALFILKDNRFRREYNPSKDEWSRDWQYEDIKSKVKEQIEEIITKESKTPFNLERIEDITTEYWLKIEHEYFRKVMYRPFDLRLTYYPKSKGFLSYPRYTLFKHFIELKKRNLGLAYCLTIPNTNESWNHTFIIDDLAEGGLISSRTSEWTLIAPLYIVSGEARQTTLGESSSLEKYSDTNFSENFKEFISNKYEIPPSPEEIMSYVYAVLNSSLYCSIYLTKLRDGIRIIFIDDLSEFNRISTLGKELIDLHTFKRLPNDIYEGHGEFFGQNSNRVEKIEFIPEEEKIDINESQGFLNISIELWEFKIGSYKVLEKWLKGRISGELHISEIQNFTKITQIIAETLAIIEEINNILSDFIEPTS